MFSTSSGFTEHFTTFGPYCASPGTACCAHGSCHTGSHWCGQRTACAGPLLPTVPCPTHCAPQHRSHAAAPLGVMNAPGLSSGNNGLPQFYINTAQQKHPRIATWALNTLGWHCHKAMAGSAAGEQSHQLWDNGMVYELTQSTATIESSHMRLPEESACIFF